MALSWLNNEFLSLVLKASCGGSAEDIRVVDFKVKRAVEGDNYTSVMYKVHVWYKQKTEEEIRDRSFIFKSTLLESFQSMVEKETSTYVNALPKIEGYMDDKFAPKLLLFKNGTLVMENITEHGFKNVNSSNLLDYNHCVVALQKLARFHAGTVMLHRKEPELVERKIGWEVCFNGVEQDVISCLGKMFYTFEKEISTWSEARHHAHSFNKIRKNIDSYFKNITDRKCLKVLNHGDFWLNNLMFGYDSLGAVKDVRLVDFQGCRFGSPACDIQYFLASSTNLNVRLHRVDDLLEAYLSTLNEALARLNIPKRMSWKQFEESLHEEYMMYFIGLVISLCTCLNDPRDRFCYGDCDTFEALDKETNAKFENLLKSARYRNFITPVLDDIERKGAFLSFR